MMFNMKGKADPFAGFTQLDLFATIDAPVKAKEAQEWIEKRLAKYELWKSLPEVQIVKEGSYERENLAGIIWENAYDIYQDAKHKCETMPDNVYIWQNPVAAKDYWVLNFKGNPGGEKCDTCPYCKAKLSQGKGDALIFKATAERWEKNLKEIEQAKVRAGKETER